MKRTGQEMVAHVARRMMNYAEAAAHLGVKLATLRSMVSRRQIPHVRLSARLVLFDAAELDRYLADHAVPAATSAGSGLRIVGGGQ